MCIGVPGQIRTIDGNQAKVDVCGIQPVSYTHLTLPTICSV